MYHYTNSPQPLSKLNHKSITLNTHPTTIWWPTFNTSGGGILQGIYGHRNRGGPRRRIRNFSYFRCALSEIRPLMATSITKPIGNCTIGTIYYTCTSRVFYSGNCFFILMTGSVDVNEGLDSETRTGSTVWGSTPLGWWALELRKIYETWWEQYGDEKRSRLPDELLNPSHVYAWLLRPGR